MTQAKTKHLYNICTMLAQRLRRWSNVVQMLYKCFVFTGTLYSIFFPGNNWGICEDGRGELGCGPQEEFYGCADIEILKASTGNPPVSVTSTSTTTTTTVSPDAASPDTCVAIGPWQGSVRVDAWCQVNCHFTPPFCPITMCFCPLK